MSFCYEFSCFGAENGSFSKEIILSFRVDSICLGGLCCTTKMPKINRPKKIRKYLFCRCYAFDSSKVAKEMMSKQQVLSNSVLRNFIFETSR